MRRTFIIATGLICASAAAYAANEVLSDTSPEVIEIAVTEDRLADCRETLRQVAAQPAVADNGSKLFFTFDRDLPQVRCVVETAA